MSQGNSYGQILRSSSIMGGSQAINYVVSLLRVKLVAVLIGPAGVGLVGLLTSVTSLLSTVSALGISNSGVRQLAQHEGDPRRVARDAVILQWVGIATGIGGWILAVLLSGTISRWMTGGDGLRLSIALLGSVVFLTCTTMANQAVLQGLRRVGDLARASIYGVIVASIISVALFAWLREEGVVPVLIVSASVTAAGAWWYVHRLGLPRAKHSFYETTREAAALAKLGLVFVWSGLLTAGIDMLARSLVTRQFGMEEAGVYQAAWALSGMFAGFVLGAMGTDFYPRLSALIGDRPAAVRAVNEQTEIGLLLALPGLIGTLCLSPWIMPLLYTREFLPAADVLPWFVLGVLGRVISWPLGFIQLASGSARWFAITETTFIAVQAGLLLWLVPTSGAKGAGLAFAITYAAYVPAMLWVGNRLIAHRWSQAVLRLVIISAAFGVIAFVIRYSLQGPRLAIAGVLLTLFAGMFALRELAKRLSPHHSLLSTLRKLPGAGWLI